MIDLKSVVRKYPECLDSATKFKSYMMDLYPDNSNKARIRILVDIVDCGIALEIKNGKTDSISISNYCNTMENQYGYSVKLVEECINQFLVAFGFDLNANIKHKGKVETPKTKQKTIATPTRKKKNEVIDPIIQTNSRKATIKKDNDTSACNPDDFEIENGELKKYKGSKTSFSIPTDVKKIGDKAFWCLRRLEKVIIPDGATHIGDNAFGGSGLKNITIPNSIKYIGRAAFSNCKITSFTIPDGVTEIMDDTFYSCLNLEEIIIPKSVAKISYSAFTLCYRLKTVYFYSEEQKNKFAHNFDYNVKRIVKSN